MSTIQDNNVQNIVVLRRRLMNFKHGNNETIEVIIDSFIDAEGNINKNKTEVCLFDISFI